MATKISYSSAARTPRYGVISAPKPKTYATLAQPATQPLNPLYRAMQSRASTPSDLSSDAVTLGNVPQGLVGGNVSLAPAPKIQPPAAPGSAAATGGGSGGSGGSGSGSGSGGGSAGGNTFDLSGDPILAQIKALGEKSIGDAEAGALGLKKQAFIRSGFGDLARTVLGDDTTARAAADNPLSTLAQLMQTHTQRRNQIDLEANARNTFYGSARANALGDEAKQYLFDQAGAQSALYDLLSQIDQSVLAAKNRAQDDWITALPGAYTRAKAEPGAGTSTAGAAGSTSDGSGGGAGSNDGAGATTNYGSGPAAFEDAGANQLLALMLAAKKPKQPVALY